MKKKFLVMFFILSSILMVSGASAITTSVSEVDYVDTPSDFFGEDRVLISFTVDGTGETLNAEVPKNQILAAADADEAKDVEISAEVTDVSAEYDVDSKPELIDLYAVDYLQQKFSTEDEAQNWAEANCINPSNTDDYYSIEPAWRVLYTDWYVTCAKRDLDKGPAYNIGDIDHPPSLNVDVEWTVNVEGEEPKTVTLGNSIQAEPGQTSDQARVGGVVQIGFEELNNLGEQASNPDDSLAAYSPQTGWKIISQSEYTEWRQNLQNNLQNDIDEIVNGPVSPNELEELINEKESEKNSRYNSASSTYTGSTISGANEISGSSEVDNGVFRHTPDSQFSWFTPEFTLQIAGDFIGIEKTFGTPSINSVDNEPVNVAGSVGSGTAQVSVTNVGSGTGAFDLSGSCSEGFSLSGTTETKSFGPGDTKTFLPTVEADGDSDMAGSCTVTVQDSESLESDTFTFDVNFETDPVCDSDQVIVEDGDEVIYECTDEGLVEKDVCGEGEQAVPEGESYVCEDISDPGGGGGTEGECGLNPLCHINNVLDNRFGGGNGGLFNFGILGTIDIVVSFVAGIAGFGFFAQTLSNYVAPTVSSATRLSRSLVALLLGVLGFILVFYLAFVLISSIFIKIFLIIALLGYVYIQGLIPSV